MALSIVNQWPATSGPEDNEIPITPTDGNWLVACVAWRTTDGTVPQMSVGDLKRNLWSLGRLVVNAAAGIGVQVWVCPVVKTYGGTSKVYVAPSFIAAADAGSVPSSVVEVAGVTGGLQIDASVVGTAAAANSITLTAPIPGGSANCLQVAAAATDIAFGSVTTTGTGWTALTSMVDAAPNVGMAAAWREATTGGSVTFALTAGFFQNWAGVVVSIRAAGALPAITPDWGGAVALEAQLALGYDQATPVSAMRWLTLSTACQAIHTQRGLSAELGSVEASPNTFSWLNDQGAFTPRAAGSAVCTVAGTTGTAKISDVEATGFTVGDFVRLQTYAGVLKEDTVFQVTSMLSAAGVTTVSFAPSSAVSTAVGDVLVGVPVDVFVPIRTVATVDGKTYPVMVGASEALPQAWLDGTHGRVQMTAVDAYATLTATLPEVLDGEVLRGRPVEYWRLDDPQASGQAANSAPGSTTVLQQKTSKFGAAAATADFGSSSQDITYGPAATQVASLFGSSASGWGQTGLVAADSTKGFALVGSSDSFPPITPGVTIVGFSCMFVTQPTSGDTTIVIIRNRDPAGGGGAGSIIKLALEPSTAFATITVWDKDTHASTRTVCSPDNIIGNSGWIPWALTFTRTGWTLYTSGTFTHSGSADLVAEFNTIDVGGEADAAWNGHCGNAVHSRYAIYDRIMTASEINQLDLAAIIGMSQTTATDGTIRRQLSRVGWPGARILTRSDILTSEDNGLEGGAVGDVVAQIATWEDGLLGVDAAGYLRFLSRDVLDRAVSKFTLGPNTGGGEIPYLGAPNYNADGQLLFTRIDVTNTAKIGAYLPGFPADASGTYSSVGPLAASKGVRPRSWPTHLYRRYDVYQLGQWLVARYGVPQLRITAVQVDPRATPGTAGWHAVLGAEIGDLITVNWKPGGAPAINTRCIIIGITHDATPSRWITTFTLMVAPDPGIILDDPVAGVIASGTLTL